MPTLNRFPLLGLWAEEAARRIGYPKNEAESLGHAYAVLYAIRAQRVARPKAGEEEAHPPPRRKAPRGEEVEFGGDKLAVTHDAQGHLRGKVGGDKPQTPRTYQASVRAKFPPGYYEKLESCFRRLLKKFPPSRLNSRLVYGLYDEWKKSCGEGRRVDLDKLLRWCRERAAGNAE
ncbi:MAG TPA: hypothetical protein VG013_38195 [Gemmataceae bacterium]|jgi:hypothetical protein|nr:hypothetical protein [Gemmataceae bacterium]